MARAPKEIVICTHRGFRVLWWVMGLTVLGATVLWFSPARTLMMQWLPVTDPLRIADDPECGYDQPAGFVN